MVKNNLRKRIAVEAARLIYARQETDIFRAKMKSARWFYTGEIKPFDLPKNSEVRSQLQILSVHESKRLAEDMDIDEREQLTAQDRSGAESENAVDRFRIFELLLLPLETVKENPEYHPEGDVLYHSLQTFDLAREKLPYDEEFLLAALLHDIGKAIDRADHVSAGLDAVAMHITSRTAWLIEHHTEAQAIHDGTLGVRSRRRLEANENFDELMLLAECDDQARAVGVATSDVTDALEYIRGLSDFTFCCLAYP